MRYGVDLNALNVRRVRDPNGYYVVAMGVELLRILENKVRELGLEVEVVGNIALVRDKSWSRVRRLVEVAKSRGIRVIED